MPTLPPPHTKHTHLRRGRELLLLRRVDDGLRTCHEHTPSDCSSPSLPSRRGERARLFSKCSDRGDRATQDSPMAFKTFKSARLAQAKTRNCGLTGLHGRHMRTHRRDLVGLRGRRVTVVPARRSSHSHGLSDSAASCRNRAAGLP